MNTPGKASLPVIKRLPKYYRYLRTLRSDGITSISSRELAAQMGSTFSEIIPKRTDSLVFPSEVRSILRISNSTLKQYCREGRLTPVLTPPRGKTKFWLSQVLAIRHTLMLSPVLPTPPM